MASANQQAMIVDMFSSSTIVPNQMDVQNTPLYDSFNIPAGSTLSTPASALFTTVGPASGKTYAQTNMQVSRQLPSPEAFAILGFRLRYSENISVLDLFNLLNGFAFEFWMNNKNYQRGPIPFYAGGMGVYGFSTVAATNIFNNGMPGRSEMHKTAVTLVIENTMTFYGQLAGNSQVANAAGNGITLYCVLDGLYARGVA